MYIDFHTHAFPDELAATTVPYLEKEGHIKAWLNGTVDDLLRSMDRAGIEKSVICTIATRTKQFHSILKWAKKVRSDRLVVLPSVHPESETLPEQIQTIAAAGFCGIKMHPYYQDFSIDEDRLTPLYEALITHNLLLVMHTGFDIAFPRTPLCDPTRIIKITERFPELRLVTSHFGAWDDWDEVRRLLIGRPLYMDLSYALDFLEPEAARQMIIDHPADYLLFGSDSPWSDQKKSLNLLRALNLAPALFQKITRGNAEKLLSATCPS